MFLKRLSQFNSDATLQNSTNFDVEYDRGLGGPQFQIKISCFQRFSVSCGISHMFWARATWALGCNLGIRDQKNYPEYLLVLKWRVRTSSNHSPISEWASFKHVWNQKDWTWSSAIFRLLYDKPFSKSKFSGHHDLNRESTERLQNRTVTERYKSKVQVRAGPESEQRELEVWVWNV